MGKTGGGKGTNQYAVQGVSQASRQGTAVLDDLAAAEPSWGEGGVSRPRIIDPPRFSQFQEHDCHICGHESLRRPVWIDRGGGPEPVGSGCLSGLLGIPAKKIAAERDLRREASKRRAEVIDERLARYRVALFEYQTWEDERRQDPLADHIVQRDPAVSVFNRLRREWVRSDPDLLPPAAFAQWLQAQIAQLEASYP